MTEKIGLIKNPLTIIAIFAGLAEVSGTLVLPFIAESNQRLFIIFLIVFPSLLILSFFITLNFNNKVLYAPSDYKDEANYVKINRYDLSKQELIEFKVPKQSSLDEVVAEVKSRYRFSRFEKNGERLIRHFTESKFSREPSSISPVNTPNYVEISDYDLLVSNFYNADQFIWHMKKLGVNFRIYTPPDGFEYEDDVYSFPDHQAIWLGSSISLEAVKFLIRESKKYYSHLKYIVIMDSSIHSPNEDKQLYIGGSTDAAVKKMGRIPLQNSDFAQLNDFTDLSSLHNFINKFDELI